MMMVRSMKTSNMILLCQSSFWLDPPTPYKARAALSEKVSCRKMRSNWVHPEFSYFYPPTTATTKLCALIAALLCPTELHTFLGTRFGIWSLYKKITFCNSALAVPTPNLGCYAKLNQCNCPRFHTVVFFWRILTFGYIRILLLKFSWTHPSIHQCLKRDFMIWKYSP